MTHRVKSWMVQLMRVPPEPEPPAGAPESVRVFRAAPNFYRLKLIKWMGTQLAALAGMVTFLWMPWMDRLGEAAMPLRVIETGALIIFFIQLPITYLILRFDYEMRWYIVTDRSLRIRYGIQQVREMTMTFANIQQITIKQGPLQRALGIADLQVRTAGGGAGDSTGEGSSHGSETDSMHLGFFRGVANAPEIRDLMLARLRRWQDAGLGDPDDLSHPAAEMAEAEQEPEVASAAARVLTEARALRQTVESRLAGKALS